MHSYSINIINKKNYENFIFFVQYSVDRHTALYLRRAAYSLVPSDCFEIAGVAAVCPPPQKKKSLDKSMLDFMYINYRLLTIFEVKYLGTWIKTVIWKFIAK